MLINTYLAPVHFGIKDQFEAVNWESYIRRNPGVTLNTLTTTDTSSNDARQLAELFLEVKGFPSTEKDIQTAMLVNEPAISNPKSFFFLVKRGDKAIGSVAFRATGLLNVVEATNFFVREEERGGLGYLLLRELAHTAKKRQVRIILLGSLPHRKRLIDLYCRLGCVKLSEPDKEQTMLGEHIYAKHLADRIIPPDEQKRLINEYIRIQQERQKLVAKST